MSQASMRGTSSGQAEMSPPEKQSPERNDSRAYSASSQLRISRQLSKSAMNLHQIPPDSPSDTIEKRRIAEAYLESPFAKTKKQSNGTKASPKRKRQKTVDNKGQNTSRKTLKRQESSRSINSDLTPRKSLQKATTQKSPPKTKASKFSPSSTSSSRISSPRRMLSPTRSLTSPKRKRTPPARLNKMGGKAASSPDFMENVPQSGMRGYKDSALLIELKSQIVSLQSTVQSQNQTICVLHEQNDRFKHLLEDKEKWMHDREFTTLQIEQLTKRREHDAATIQHMKGHLRSVEHRLALRERCMHEKDMSILLLQEEVCEVQRRFSDTQYANQMAQQQIETQLMELSKLRHFVQQQEIRRASNMHTGTQCDNLLESTEQSVQMSNESVEMSSQTNLIAFVEIGTQKDDAEQQLTVRTLRMNLKAAQQEIASLQQQLTSSEEKLSMYRERSESLQQQLTNQMDQHSAAFKSIEQEYSSQKRALQKKMTTFKQQFEGKVRALHKACELYRKSTHLLSQELSDTRQSIRDLQVAHKSDVGSLHSEVTALEQKYSPEINTDHDQTTKLTQIMEERLQNLVQERDHDKRVIVKLEQELKATEDVLNSKVSALQNEMEQRRLYQEQAEEFQQKLTLSQQATMNVCEECTMRDKSLHEWQVRVDQLADESLQFRSSIERLSHEKAELMKELQTQLQTGRRLMDLNTTLKEVKLNAERELEEQTKHLNKEIASLSSKCHALETENIRLSAVVDTLDHDRIVMEDRVRKLQHDLKERSSQLEGENHTLREVRNQLQQELKNARSLLHEAQEKLSHAELQMEQLSSHRAELNKVIASLQQKEKEVAERNAFQLQCLLSERNALKLQISKFEEHDGGPEPQKRQRSTSNSSTTQVIMRQGIQLQDASLKPSKLKLDSKTIVSQLRDDHHEVVVQSPIRSPLCISSCRTISTVTSFQKMHASRKGFPLADYVRTMKFAVGFLLRCGVVPNRLILFMLLKLALLA